jgi:hypothetical protein
VFPKEVSGLFSIFGSISSTSWKIRRKECIFFAISQEKIESADDLAASPSSSYHL